MASNESISHIVRRGLVAMAPDFLRTEPRDEP